MLFSSIPFLYYFLPLTVLCYFCSKNFMKNGILLLFSLIFYYWGGPSYLILMVSSIVLSYVFGLLIGRFRKRFLLVLAVGCHLGLLGYFKYADFFLSTVQSVTGLNLPLLHVVLPIGISFYTFQIISYLIDVYRGDVTAQRNPIDYAAYVSFFPQLIAGPIVRYQDIAKELQSRETHLCDIYDGCGRFLVGLGKKVLLANSLGALCADYRAAAAPSTLFAWMSAVSYMLQIYFDFSGYSDMAIGLGRLFGFHFPENFNYPFISKTITEFWRRWHMTLGGWFRDYVYIPLGGSRVGKGRLLLNIFIVWALTGLWHGAAWNFVLWGLFFAVLLAVEKLTKPRLPAALSHAAVLLLVLFSFVLFGAESLSQVGTEFAALFGSLPAVTAETLYALRSNAALLLVAAIGSTPLPKRLFQHIRLPDGLRTALQLTGMALLLLVCTAYLVDGSFNPFLYFRF